LQVGQAVIAECQTFESMNLFEMNKKLQTKEIEDVIAEITGEDVTVMKEIVGSLRSSILITVMRGPRRC
jgi:hypothetical protein